MKFQENDVVKILTSKNGHQGKLGTVICVFENPNEAYDVEFINDDGITDCVLTFLPDELEIVTD